MIDLDKLEALAYAATPGPWLYQEDSDTYTHIVRPAANPGMIVARGCQTSAATGEPTGRFIAAANPAAVLELIALARHADSAETVAIPLVSGDELLARAAQPVQQPAPVAEPHYEAGRKQGRAEALAILMQLDPEGGIDEYTGWSTPVGPEDGHGIPGWRQGRLECRRYRRQREASSADQSGRHPG